MPAPKKKIVVVLGDKQPKKSVVRYNGVEGEALSNAYISKEAIEELGDPEKVRVTIEAA